MNMGFQPDDFSSVYKVVKLLLCRLLLTIVFIILVLVFKYIMHFVLFLPEVVCRM